MRWQALKIIAMVCMMAPLAAYAFGDRVNNDDHDDVGRHSVMDPLSPVIVNSNTATPATPPVISIGANHASGMRVQGDGSLWFFGNNDYGQFGTGNKNENWTTWQQIPGINYAWKVAGGYNFTYLVGNDQRVYATGNNDDGQLGSGNQLDQLSFAPSYIYGTSNQLGNIVQIAAGREHGLAIDSNNRLWVVGDNDAGQLGISPNNMPDACTIGSSGCAGSPLLSAGWQRVNPGVFGGHGVVQVAALADSSLVLLDNGDVYGCGLNDTFDIGYPTNGTYVLHWVKVASGMTSIGSGWYQSFGIDQSHHLWAAGRNDYGQLGNGTTSPAQQWVQVDGVNTYQSVGTSSGIYTSYAIGLDGSLYATGDNSSGQFGNNSNVGSSSWIRVLPGPVSAVVTLQDIPNLDSQSSALGAQSYTGSGYTMGVALQNSISWYAGALSNGMSQPYWLPN